MTIWLLFSAAFAALVGTWAWWHRPTWLSVWLYPLIFVAGMGVGGELLGRAKPHYLDWRNPSTVEVIGYKLYEGKAIYIWIVPSKGPEPLAIALPWDLQTAMQLRRAGVVAQQEHSKLMAKLPRGQSLETRKPMFYADPQPPLPDKDYGPESPS